MFPNMDFHPFCSSVTFIAESALKDFACMSLFVHFRLLFGFESLIAENALVGTDTCVSPDVGFIVPRFLKLFMAAFSRTN